MAAATQIPVDGRLTSLQLLNIPLAGDEVMYIVSPGNEALGNSFQVTTAVLGAYFASFPYSNTVEIPSGVPYTLEITDTRVLVTLDVAAPTSITAPPADTMFSTLPVLIKDVTGDASINPITITFSDGELCDGLSSIEISNPYGWTTLNVLPDRSGWYQT